MFVELNGIPWIISFITIYLKTGERGTINWWDTWLPRSLCNPFRCFKSKEKNVTHDRNIKRSLYLTIIIILNTYYYTLFSLKHIITGDSLSFNLFWPPFYDGAEFYCMDLILFSVFNTFPKYFRFWFHSHLSLNYGANPFFLSIPSTYHMLDLERSSGSPEELALCIEGGFRGTSAVLWDLGWTQRTVILSLCGDSLEPGVATRRCSGSGSSHHSLSASATHRPGQLTQRGSLLSASFCMGHGHQKRYLLWVRAPCPLPISVVIR